MFASIAERNIQWKKRNGYLKMELLKLIIAGNWIIYMYWQDVRLMKRTSNQHNSTTKKFFWNNRKNGNRSFMLRILKP